MVCFLHWILQRQYYRYAATLLLLMMIFFFFFHLCKSTFPSALKTALHHFGRSMLSFYHAGHRFIRIHSSSYFSFAMLPLTLLLLLLLFFFSLFLLLLFQYHFCWCQIAFLLCLYTLSSLIYLKFNFKSGNKIWL